MLENIKATYFIKLLFKYIDERHKLKVVKFNKSLQNIINISISNYKFFLQKYTINEQNGIRKEYYGRNDFLLYEGEYLNGKRNGKGKEYDWKGDLIFDGIYLNDNEWIGTRYNRNGNIEYKITSNMNGKGKEYKYVKLSFEGEYLNAERHGKGKEYDLIGNLLYEGEYLKGKRHGKGKGKEYYDNITAN